MIAIQRDSNMCPAGLNRLQTRVWWGCGVGRRTRGPLGPLIVDTVEVEQRQVQPDRDARVLRRRAPRRCCLQTEVVTDPQYQAKRETILTTIRLPLFATICCQY